MEGKSKLDSPDRRREPVLESKRLAPVASTESVFGNFEETEVHPGNEEPELDKDVGGRAEDESEDV